jgi:transposase
MERCDLGDEELRVVAPLLPKPGKGKRRVDDEFVESGIVYVVRANAPWRNATALHHGLRTVQMLSQARCLAERV